MKLLLIFDLKSESNYFSYLTLNLNKATSHINTSVSWRKSWFSPRPTRDGGGTTVPFPAVSHSLTSVTTYTLPLSANHEQASFSTPDLTNWMTECLTNWLADWLSGRLIQHTKPLVDVLREEFWGFLGVSSLTISSSILFSLAEHVTPWPLC